MKELTKAELQVMQYVWKLEKAVLKDIVAQFPEPRPAYTTISTVVRVLVDKEFLAFRTYSRVHEYYPLISKGEYFSQFFQGMVSNFFGGSLTGFASYFTEMEDLSLTELEEINRMLEDKINQKKEDHD